MTRIIRLPDMHQHYHDARRVIRSPFSSWDDVAAALDVLDHSRDWADIDLCRHTREAMRLYAPKPTPRAVVTEAQFARIMERAPVRPTPHTGPLTPFVVPLVILACLLVATLIVGPAFETAWTIINASAVGL